MRRLLVAIAACALPLSRAWACGPDFPQALLDDRKASLLSLPEGTFAFEAAHLLPTPNDRMKPAESSPWDDAAEAHDKAESAGLSATELSRVKAMRAAPDAASAAAAGKGLAPELFDYTLGAMAFKRGDHAEAIAHFKAVLALTPPERPRRGLWARYMLGRANVASGDTDAAVAAFATVRERVLEGGADPQGLAVASFGEQARIAWHRGAIAPAVKLYAEQAARGSPGGGASLLFVARSLLAHRDQLDEALDDPLSQRLLAAYLFTRSGEFAQDWPRAGTTDPSKDTADGADASDAGPRKSPNGIDVEAFLAAVEHHGLRHLEGADRLAAGAYNAGRYPLAARLAAKSDSALAAWVRAKLALRAGDKAAALREYATAAKGFPTNEEWGAGLEEGVNRPVCRVEAERGLLALGRDDYVEAMARLYAGAAEFWTDAAYVAERVLTVDELKAFVDRNAPAPAKPAASTKDDGAPASPAEQLRRLLARRLMRAGRDAEALAYFDDPDVRKKAQALIDARKDDRAWSSVTRSAALFRQARIVREDGMELLGTELAPDNAGWGGDFPASDTTPKGEYVGKGEPARFAASAAHPDTRYHYRYVAANLAERAATLVPARSQAYAAMMCHSARWMIDTDTASANRIYRRYLRNGARVSWGRDFGRKCPEPDFAAARWLPWKQAWWNTRHWTKREWPFLLVGLGVLAGLFAWRMRRRKAAPDATA